jgi:hypothetical protein
MVERSLAAINTRASAGITLVTLITGFYPYHPIGLGLPFLDSITDTAGDDVHGSTLEV